MNNAKRNNYWPRDNYHGLRIIAHGCCHCWIDSTWLIIYSWWFIKMKIWRILFYFFLNILGVRSKYLNIWGMLLKDKKWLLAGQTVQQRCRAKSFLYEQMNTWLYRKMIEDYTLHKFPPLLTNPERNSRKR
jgi:hypothetical protein